MLNTTQMIYFNKMFLLLTLKTMSKDFYCFNEDTSDVQNFYFKNWNGFVNQTDANRTVKIGYTQHKERQLESDFNLNLWQNAAEMKNIRYEFEIFTDVVQCLISVFSSSTGLCLIDVSDQTTEDTILPFLTNQYGIYYKINDFHVSSTFFIEGMSHDLWMFSFITLFLIFIGFLISTKVYSYYLKKTWFISDVFIYQANFWCNQTVTNYLEMFPSWKIQLLNGFMFNIIIMTAFTAKFVGLMSIRHFEQPFNSLEDFATLRSHTLCLNPRLPPMLSFLKENPVSDEDVYLKWRGIVNQPVCDKVAINFHDSICKEENVAVIYSENQYIGNRIKCPIYELTGMVPNAYLTHMMSKGFKHKEKINQAYVKMREVGIVDRMSKKYRMKKDPVRNFQDHYSDKYNVQDEGVMFDHVKIIVISYFLFLPIPLIILLLEIMIHRYKNRILII